MNETMIAIDLSMRSTGIVRLTLKNKLVNFKIIKNTELDYEELLVWNAEKIVEFCISHRPEYIAFEGLSFMSKSAKMDMIYGNFWNARCAVRKEFGDDMPIGAIPVLSWRNSILSKQELKNAKKIKEGLKIAVVNKLSKDIKNHFEKYISLNKFPKKSIYDLADAYHIGHYRNTL